MYSPYDGTVRKEEDVEFWYSESPEFVNDYKVTDCISGENNKATLYFESLTPGKTYYVRARVKMIRQLHLHRNTVHIQIQHHLTLVCRIYL